MANFHLQRGQAILLSGIKVHKTNPIEQVSLVLAKDNQTGELWYVLSSEKVTLQTLREYGFRFDIEENFLDDKSNGFNLESSMIRSSIALSRLCLVKRARHYLSDPSRHGSSSRWQTPFC